MPQAMPTDHLTLLLNPVIQYGFAGFCVVLMGVVIWQFRCLVGVLRENNKIITASNEIISKNSDAIGHISTAVMDQGEEARRLFEALLTRPCLLDPSALRLLASKAGIILHPSTQEVVARVGDG